MAEQPPSRDPSWRDVARAGANRSAQDGNNGTAGGPGRRPSNGWRVTPAPDGREGAQAGGRSRGPNPRWLVVLIVLGLLALNLYISSQALQPAQRVQIPYSPNFLAQAKNNNVSSISSTGESIQGTLKHAITYPANGKNAQTTALFSTQIPSFANNDQLFKLLADHGVTINAHPVQNNPSLISEILFGRGGPGEPG